ncbi:MAG: hypothetical protein ACKVII_07760 [Planctomycetales bacterium]|jgi:hypothetical protein
MNTNSQTLKFVIAAAVMAGLAGLTSSLTKPTPIDDFANVGNPFFADFNPNAATAVRVVAYNEDTASARVFTVQKKDGTWRIPSHHNYPADGEDRLAKTARTLIGVKRGAVASRVAADHERFGVVDPLGEASDTLKGRGQRLTLMKDSEIAVADLIIGKKLPEGENRYYVRHPEEKETYITELEVDISTKFGDWVEADLLKLDRDDLTKLEAKSTKVDGRSFSEVVDATLSRANSTDDWALGDLNEETEEVNKDDVTAMVNVLDNLKLSGVRRKPELAGKPILQGDLGIALPPSAAQNPQIVNQVIDMVQSSLKSKGFLVYQNREANDFRLYAKAGELIASLKDGVRFHMSFGNEFEGSDDEIEIGGTTAEAEKSEDAQKPADPPGSEEADDEEKEDGKDGEKKTKSRYLIVRASFSEDLLGPALLVPVKPEVPEGVEVDADGNFVKPAEEPAEKTEDAAAAEKTDDAEKTDAAATGDVEKADDAQADDANADADKTVDANADDAKAAAEKTEEAAAEEKKEEPNLGDIYQRAIEKFRADQRKYESDVKDREKKAEEGQKKVDELNDRFADWYYVITEEDFGKLRLSRDQLVKAKEKEAGEEGDDKGDAAAPVGDPAASILNSLPGAKPAPAKPADAKPAAPAADDKTPAGDAPKTDDAKPAATTPEPAKPDAAKPEAAKPPEPAKPEPAKPEASKPAKPTPAKPTAPAKEPAPTKASPEPEKPAEKADATTEKPAASDEK